MQPLNVNRESRSLRDLKRSAEEVIQRTRHTGNPVILTERGQEVAVVMSIETYRALQANQVNEALQHAVEEAEADIAVGRYVEHNVVKQRLQQWMSGEHG